MANQRLSKYIVFLVQNRNKKIKDIVMIKGVA
jgi:hypothetical protein